MTGSGISVVGISHKTAPLERRERFAFSPRVRRQLLAKAAGESVILVTCNRTELYGVVEPAELGDRLNAAAGVRGEQFYAYEREAAVRHLYSVAAGLDSMVLGEPQILGQVKRAMADARRATSLGPLLDELFRRALHVGRRVRRDTDVGRGLPSVPKVATGMARAALGSLADRRMLVVGAGKLGQLTAAALHRAGATDIIVVNRNPRASEELARVIDATPRPFEELERQLASAAIVLTCTASQRPIFTRPMLERVLAGRPDQPLVIIDIAVPRDVDAGARGLNALRLIDLDDLRGWSSNSVSPEALTRAQRIIEHEAVDFDEWLSSRTAIPTIRALRDRADRILAHEIEHAAPEDREALIRFGHRVVNKLLHHPMSRLKQRAATDGDAYLALARDLFALDVDFPRSEENGRESDDG